MKRTLSDIFGILSGLVFYFLSATIVLAEVDISAPFPGEGSEGVTLMEHLRAAITWAYAVGTLLAVFMIVFGGFKYIVSAGNPQALQDAKDMVIGALVGLLILLLLYLLLPTLGLPVKLPEPG